MNASGRYIIYQMLTSQSRKQEVVKHEPIMKQINNQHETIKLEPLRIGLMSHEVEVKEDAARKKYRKKWG